MPQPFRRRVRIDPLLGPGQQGQRQTIQVEAALAEPIFTMTRLTGSQVLEDYAKCDKSVKSIHEDVSGYSQILLEAVEVPGPEEAFTNHQRAPAIADDLLCPSNRTIL
jgi:hypothetical protein